MTLSILTFNDAIAHLRDTSLGISQDGELAILKRAARAAYRDLMDVHRWQYGYIEYGVRVEDDYSTGTIAYDDTGGAFERMVSLTSGTWPTEAAKYKLFAGTGIYPVAERKSASVLTLDATMNPGADIAAGTSYTLYRDTYPLPDDFLKMDEVLSQDSPWFNYYIPPAEYLRIERTIRGVSARPFRWCVPTDHEILTQRGWKFNHELVVGENVMAYDHKTGQMAWQPLLAVEEFDCDEEIFTLEREKGGKEFLFTKDHRWPVVMKESKQPKMVKASELTGATLIPNRGEFVDDGSTVLSPRLAAIAGWACTDGSKLWSKKHWEACVWQSTDKHFATVVDLLGTKPCGPYLCSHADYGASGNTIYSIPIAKEDRHAIRQACPTRDDLPRIACHLSREAAESMWQAMFMAEGSTSSAGQQTFTQNVRRNRAVIETFQILSLMTGRNASLSINEEPTTHHEVRMQCNILKQKYVSPANNGGLNTRHYKGKVWCPSTRWGTWVMRHNGHVLPTGNTIMQDADRPGGWCIRVVGHPTDAANLVFLYQRAFREPVLSGHESFSYSTTNAITVATAASSYTVTGTGTAFNQKMAGSVLRVSEDGTNLPTDNGGAYPFSQELYIKSVESATSLTLLTPATQTNVGRKFVISDALDMDRTMFNAYLRACEWQAAVVMGKNVGENAKTNRDYLAAVRLAMQQDNKVTVMRVAGGPGGFVGPLTWLLAFGGVTHNQGVS